jgi:hypothetical protein
MVAWRNEGMPNIRNLCRTALLAFAAAGLAYSARSADLPNLPETALYKNRAHNCHPVDLLSWNHPTKQVLLKYHVELFSLELCNADKYPIFHVNFAYDPMGSTSSFFGPFYSAMFNANSHNPMAFVETTSGNVIAMIDDDHGLPAPNYEQYKQ